MKLIRNTIASTTIALLLPGAVFAQSAGASTAGNPAGSGNPPATDILPSGQGNSAVTTGTSASGVSLSPGMVHPNNTNSSAQTTGNGIPVTTGTSADVTGTSGNSH